MGKNKTQNKTAQATKDSKPAVKERIEEIIEPKSDIDSILDDWLNGADEEIPDELPEINDIKEEKKNVKNMKTDKKNKVLSDMSKLSNIMDDKANKNVQSSVEGWFSGNKVTKEVPKKEEPAVVKKVEEVKKEEEVKKPVEVEKARVPEGDCAVCGHLAKLICGGCKNVFYCKRECQKKHWSSHKEDCKTLVKLPYRVNFKLYTQKK